MQDVTILDEPSAPPTDLPYRDLALGLFQPGESDQLVTLALAPAAAWVAEYYPCERVEDQGDGRLVVTLRTGSTAWVRRLALSLGAGSQVLRPTALAEAVRQDARLALAAYADQPAPPGAA